MKQLLIPRPEVLTVRDAPNPPVADGMVRIRVRAAGLNFSDLLARQGLYPDAPKPPCVVGYELAGVVDSVGSGVTAVRAGDRVMAMTRSEGRICFGASELSMGFTPNLPRVASRFLRWPRFGPMTLMSDNRAVAGVNLGRLWRAAGSLQPQMQVLLGLAHQGRIKPRVDQAFPVEEAAAAHRYLHERRNIGQVVLTF